MKCGHYWYKVIPQLHDWMLKMKKYLAGFIVGLTVLASSSMVMAKSPEGCRSYSSGRTTCSQSDNGITSYQSYNPYSGYSSNGWRSSSGSSSYGYNNYSTPSSNGWRSYSSNGLGSGSTRTNSNGYNSNKGYYSNSYGSCYFSCP